MLRLCLRSSVFSCGQRVTASKTILAPRWFTTTKGTMAPMKYRRLGGSGLLVSELSFGSWVTFSTQVDVQAAYELMKAAYGHGINFFDNAETYAAGKSEEVMGEAVQIGLKNGTWEREDLVVSTKVFFGTKKGPNRQGLSRKHIIEGALAACKRFQLDYVDLIFCHRPDSTVPIEETYFAASRTRPAEGLQVRAMHSVIERGLAFYWGTSEWSAQQISEAIHHADRLGLHRPVMDQSHYNMFVRDRVEKDYVPLYKDYQWGLTTWSPLASGILTGKYSGKNVPEGSRLSLPDYQWLRERMLGENAWQIEKADQLQPIAKELGCSLAQLAVAWCLRNKNVSTVILGATSLTQLEENIKSLDVVDKLTDDVMDHIEKVLETKPKPDPTMAMVEGLRTY